jgi:energy-coupling factor transporter ATP-binding protein EcfA2
MHIQKVTINKHVSDRLGLAEQSLKGLSDLVVLVGPNGAGKTRLLKAVHWLLIEHQRGIESSDMHNRISHTLATDTDMQPYTGTGFAQDRDALSELMQPRTGLELKFSPNEETEFSLNLYAELHRYLSRSERSEMDELNSRLYMGTPQQDSMHWLSLTPLQYLEDACLRFAKRGRRDTQLGELAFFSSVDPEGIPGSFEALADLVKELCGVVLTMDQDGHGRINGIPVPLIMLSRGQEILLHWVVIIHCHVLRGKNVPILLDEPELHLHPKALNTLIDRLRSEFPRAQLWIATHSISLVAHLAVQHSRDIWYSDKGCFRPAGKNFQEVVTGLTGGDGGADELADFCGAVSDFAVHSFATDCLLAPTTVGYMNKDPQVEQILEHFAQREKSSLVVLDFGAGQGRLLDGLAAQCAELGISLQGKIEYYAVEPWLPLLELCKQRVEAHYGEGIVRVFPSAKEALPALRGSVDFIVLANVLHEISPAHWLPDVFASPDLLECLREDGEMLIIEDTVLPRGELAHRYGFLILESAALCRMVKAASPGSDGFQTSTVPRYGQRLQASSLDKRALARVDGPSIRNALEQQRKAALQSVRKIRDLPFGTRTYKDGRVHSYHSQLATNISLALDDLNDLGL